jgi:gluconokinase
MVGTSGAVRVIREDDGSDPRRGLFRYLLDDRRIVEGGSLSDGGNLYAWLKRTLADVDPRGLAERPADGHGLTFLPLLGGERSPGWRDDKRGAISGLSFSTTPQDIVQAAFEGLASRFAAILELMPEVEELVATGHALLANPDLLQILADVLGRELAVSAVPEASLRGVALLARGEPAGEPELAGLVRPRRERTEVYRVARIRQQELYEGAP